MNNNDFRENIGFAIFLTVVGLFIVGIMGIAVLSTMNNAPQEVFDFGVQVYFILILAVVVFLGILILLGLISHISEDMTEMTVLGTLGLIISLLMMSHSIITMGFTAFVAYLSVDPLFSGGTIIGMVSASMLIVDYRNRRKMRETSRE